MQAINRIVVVLLVVCSAHAALAHDKMHPLAPPDLSSPRATLTNFLALMDRAYARWTSESGTDEDRIEREAIGRIAHQFFDLSDVAPSVRRNVGRETAVYVKEVLDRIELPYPEAFHQQIDFYRTALHELGHWTGHPSRLDRFCDRPDRGDYAREELVAELTSAFTCAALSIVPTVRHADYIGAWLEVLKEDNRAIFRAASAASKAADYLLAYRPAEQITEAA